VICAGIIENIPCHQGGIRFDGHQNCSNRACGDRNPVAMLERLINSGVGAP